jgi:hypothetical protein
MKLPTRWAGIALAGVASIVVPVVRAQAPAPPPPTPTPSPADNAELARILQEDQDDRKPGPQGIDWKVVKPRDDARLARARELYTSGALRTGKDWFNAAVMFQHSGEANDALLAHEMSIAAVALGDRHAGWLVAAAEDRFLIDIGRKQRFGTQFEVGESGKYRLAETDPQVTDQLRDIIGTESLAVQRATASRFDKK